MVIKPAAVDTGIIFRRTDIGEDAFVEALAENVSSTARSTTISSGDASVSTIEHVLSALTGMGVDNALIDIDNVEVPILDGSAKPYVDAIWNDGFELQDAPRRYVEIKETIEIVNEEKGSLVRIEPADEFSYDIKIDFNSRVLGVQYATWDPSVVYAEEIGNAGLLSSSMRLNSFSTTTLSRAAMLTMPSLSWSIPLHESRLRD